MSRKVQHKICYDTDIFVKKYIPLLLILCLGAFLRLWQLGIVPVGVTHDEMGYIYNAFSIAKTGKNVFEQYLPFLTWMVQGGFPFMPVPIYLSVPFFWIMPISATAGRLPSALLGSLDIFLLYIFIKKVFNKESFALLTALSLAISPWHIHFSRSAYDPNYALFFYLAGMCLFLSESRKKKLPILSLIFFIIGIFSYRGMSLIALPLLLTLLLFGVFVLKITKKQIIVFLLGIILITVCLLSVALKYGSSYTQEALFFKDPKAQEIVDTNSRQAQGPLFIKRIFLNKLTYTADKLRSNYIRAYSPEYLFLYTEPSGIYSIWSRGRIYFFDLFFIILGIAYTYKTSPKKALFITSLLLIGGLPGGVGGMPYSARNFFLSIIFPIFTAGGVLFILQWQFTRRILPIVAALLAILYLYLLGSYLFDYYDRYAYYTGESWAKSIKDISLLAGKYRTKYDHIFIANVSFGDVVQYAFWNKLSAQDTQAIWKNRNASSQIFYYKNTTFSPTCPTKISMAQTRSLLYITHHDCKITLMPITIIRDYLGNPIWNVYEASAHP